MIDLQRLKFGRKIAHKRTSANMTQKELADAAGVKEVTIRNIEKGAFNVPFDILNRIATVLGGELDIRISNNN